MNLIDICMEIADANELSSSIYGLKFVTPSKEVIETYEQLSVLQEDIEHILKAISLLVPTFNKDSLPFNIPKNAINQELIKHCQQLQVINKAIKSAVRSNKLVSDDQSRIANIVLSLDNPGSYYDAIHLENQSDLKDYALRNIIQLINLHDMPFYKIAESDNSLWNIWEHCPNLKVIRLFGAELRGHELERLQLDKMKNLKAIDLAENYITHLPESFFSLQQLAFVDLTDNPIPEQQITKLKQQLKNTVIITAYPHNS